jgi:hypothetical protein
VACGFYHVFKYLSSFEFFLLAGSVDTSLLTPERFQPQIVYKIIKRRFNRMQSSNSSSTAMRWAGMIAILAALSGVAADLALQYTSNTEHLMSKQALYLLDVPPSRLLLGHYLGVAAILIETFGFWQIYRALQAAGERYALPFFLISAFGAMLGAAYHATFIFVGLTLQAQSGTVGPANQAFADLLSSFTAARIGLAIPAILGIVLSSLWYVFVVGFKASAYPRWMAICNPLVFLLLIIVITIAIPVSALILAPTALNLSHLIFFICSTAALWKIKVVRSISIT